jgi:glutathione S-transferase
MRLLFTPNSPYARKVRIVLREKNLACEEVQVSLEDCAVAQHNPLGKVPTLVADDQTALFDSVVIADYLELVKPEPRMIPPDLWERVAVRRWEAVGDGLCDILVPSVLELRRAPDKQDRALLDRAEQKTAAVLNYLDTELRDRTYAFGNQFTLADVAVLSALGYVLLRRPALLSGLNAINAYTELHTSRPSLLATVPPG